MGNTPLTTKIPIKDRDGNIIEYKEVATYAGLLAKAHEEGLKSISTKLLQGPGEDNGQTAIVEATVITDKGSYAGIGDASPQNVNRRVVAHLIRMAETRAKARALRDAVNIAMVALEELGGDEEAEPVRQERPSNVRSLPPRREAPQANRQNLDERVRADLNRQAFPTGNTQPGRSERGGSGPDNGAMTENQRRWLYRFLSDRGFEGQAATDALCRAADVDHVGKITKQVASEMIDGWKRDAEGGHAA